MTERPRGTLEVSVSFPPQKEFIAGVSELVGQFCSTYLSDPDAISRARMVTHELAENVVKYSSAESVSLSAGLVPGNPSWVLRISTRNRGGERNLTTLRRILDELGSSEDPVAYYDALITQSAKRKYGSGLGLARVSAEGEMHLRYEVAGRDVLVIADCKVELKSDVLEAARGGGIGEAEKST